MCIYIEQKKSFIYTNTYYTNLTIINTILSYHGNFKENIPIIPMNYICCNVMKYSKISKSRITRFLIEKSVTYFDAD